jgi:L,D-peptidoglycan transpeptidase YkuD (ErfK/YbiS/YcfS/YnhG family)
VKQAVIVIKPVERIHHSTMKNISRPITNAPFKTIFVRSIKGNAQRGRVFAGNFSFSCALGKGGTTRKKREGDGATPLGSFLLRRLWYRADQINRPQAGLMIRIIKPSDGWCDTGKHPRYNKPVQLPFPESHERMWRDDPLYDCVVEIGWNDQPAVPGRGSAIFMHIARQGYKPTEGCVALSKKDLMKLIARIGPKTRIIIS